MPSHSSKKILVDILAETPDYLVVNKPAGMLVHPTGKERKGNTLVEYLVAHYPDLTQVGEQKPWYRPGIVHRLDRDASGVLVVCRTQAMYDHLRHAFDHHHVEKTYRALALGTIEEDTGTIETPIARSKDRKCMITQDKNFDPALIWLPAVTHWKVLTRFPKETLVEVHTETGRTQQIRVHFSSIGHALVGDHLYGTTKDSLTRIFLHAKTLAFDDLTGVRQQFEVPIPPELEHYLVKRHKL